jgi:hypothetical protein
MRALLVPHRTVYSCTLAHSSSCQYRGLRYPPGTHIVDMHMSWERTAADRTPVIGGAEAEGVKSDISGGGFHDPTLTC